MKYVKKLLFFMIAGFTINTAHAADYRQNPDYQRAYQCADEAAKHATGADTNAKIKFIVDTCNPTDGPMSTPAVNGLIDRGVEFRMATAGEPLGRGDAQAFKINAETQQESNNHDKRIDLTVTYTGDKPIRLFGVIANRGACLVNNQPDTVGQKTLIYHYGNTQHYYIYGDCEILEIRAITDVGDSIFKFQ